MLVSSSLAFLALFKLSPKLLPLERSRETELASILPRGELFYICVSKILRSTYLCEEAVSGSYDLFLIFYVFNYMFYGSYALLVTDWSSTSSMRCARSLLVPSRSKLFWRDLNQKIAISTLKDTLTWYMYASLSRCSLANPCVLPKRLRLPSQPVRLSSPQASHRYPDCMAPWKDLSQLFVRHETLLS